MKSVVMEPSEILEVETERLIEALESIPSLSIRAGKRFLNLCQVNYVQMNQMNCQLSTLSSDMDTIFRTGVLIGHVLQIYQLEQEEVYSWGQKDEQHHAHKTARSVGSKRFTETSLLIVLKQMKTNMASQARFVRSLDKALSLLDFSINGDARSYRAKVNTLANKYQGETSRSTSPSRRESVASTSRSALDAIFSNASIHLIQTLTAKSTHAPKVISLQTSKIEKIESKIDLDIGFVHRTLFRIILQVYSALKDINEQRRWSLLGHDNEDNQSVFTTSLSPEEAPFLHEEYVNAINNITRRISEHLVEPFMRYVLNEIVEPQLEEDFGRILGAL